MLPEFRRHLLLAELNLLPQWQCRSDMAQVGGLSQCQAPVQSVVFSTSQQITVPDLEQLACAMRHCQQCVLAQTRKQVVPGVGDERASWLFVGEGPGETEDMQGLPFVGAAGKLLDNMLLSLGLRRDQDVYIANVVKCRPPDNRQPSMQEIASCFPFLEQQINLIRPKLIIALGRTAASALLATDASLASLRNRLHQYHQIPLLVTYHPAYLLRAPADKRKAWSDLKLARQTMSQIAKHL